METLDTIDKRLRYLRKKFGKSLKEVSADTGICASHFSYMEQGNRTVTERTLKVICSVYSVSEDWLRNGVGEIFVEVDPKRPKLTEKEEKLLDTFRRLKPEMQEATLTFCEAMWGIVKDKRKNRIRKKQKSENEK